MEDSEKADSEPIPKSGDASPSQGKSCALCGCATPAVRCDRCNSQIFCLSCDDMYHRHPKRKLHLRKAVDSIWSSARSPRLRRRTDLPGDPCKIPIPPPRTKKRERHTIGGRIFLKSGLELGSFGHSKVFDSKNLMPNSKDYFSGQKSPASLVGSNCDDDMSSQNVRQDNIQIYENDNLPNQDDSNMGDRSPWNTRPNIASPIQVSIPSNSPDIVTNGQAFGYPTKPQSQSVADLTGHSGPAIGHHPYHFHHPYPYMHPPVHPSYSHSMSHLNCPQCISSSWSNMMSPHPSPYFHPMPWGSAQNTMSRGHPIPGQAGPMKHSHGDLVSYPDSSFHYPYPGAGYYHNGPPMVDPNFIKDMHEHAEMQKMKKRDTDSKASPCNEEMDTTDAANVEHTSNVETEASTSLTPNPSTNAVASAAQDVQTVDEEEPVVPDTPTEPWSCLHCTFINPPGSYICQVCCKTSYGNKRSKPPEEETRSMSRDSESPLVNRDALLNTPDSSGFKATQKDEEQMESLETEPESKNICTPSEITEAVSKLTTETQTLTTTKTTDAQTQNIQLKSMASSTDSIFPKQEMSIQTEVEATAQSCSVATDPMISSQSMESLLSGVSAPPYHNRRAGWGRGATSFSTQSLYERGRSRSPMPRSASMYNEAHTTLGRDSNFASDEAMHSLSQAWLFSDPMYYKPHNQALGQTLSKEDYFDGTWGSMDRLNRRVQHKKDKGKLETKSKLHRSLDDLKGDKRQEVVHHQELMILQTVKEAERCGFSLEDLHVAYLHCGKENPVYWLEDNWSSMIKNVIALAAKYGEDNEENDVGVVTSTEAKEALRIHRGDIWDAVTECIENRQRKILELTVRGNFTQKQIADALKNNEGNVELAYADLLRASTRRHKFILSPGLSEDSEVDLNLYNPAEDSSVDHNVSISPMKAAKQDISPESKMEKKKSDFLTKLSAIRQAQSERRKAREEKELIRESITTELPDRKDVVLKEKDFAEEVPYVIRQDSEKVDEISIVQEEAPACVVEVDIKQEEVSEGEKNVADVKESVDDNIPVDFDTNWEDSQGRWIEEYDEQWDEESDSQWVGLGKKFQKMEKEFEEEAMQMAALWEKEELEDDVFEEESKDIQPEAAPDTQKKFDDWVKANLTKVDSSEYEEEETKEKVLGENITNVSLRDNLELEISHPSPLQHYPTEYDLSKSQLDSDWVDLPADEEIEKLAHDIVCEGSDTENKFEDDMISYEEEKKLRKSSDQYSDEDWEKIELDEQLQDVNELDRFTFPDKDEGEVDIDTSLKRIDDEKDLDSSLAITLDVTSQITIAEDSSVIYKNIDQTIASADILKPDIIDSLPAITSPREKLSSSDGDQPRPPVRRKSKLNSAAIEQALQNQALSENKSLLEDIPPALPEKSKNKESQQTVSDIYAIPDKTSKLDHQELEDISQVPEKTDSLVPLKPPRLPASPSGTLQRDQANDGELEVSVKAVRSKDASPVTSLSNESDSNCFADSESDTEIKRHRHKNIHRKPMKYENEFDELEVETVPKTKVERGTFEEISDVRLKSNIELEDDLDLEPLEPLPPMKDIDYDPELPILLAGRGSRISDIEDVKSPKAFREDTARPLQLFKAIKKEAPLSPLSVMSVTSPVTLENTAESVPFAPLQPVSSTISESAAEVLSEFAESSALQSALYENQAVDGYYYNETISPQSIVQNQMSDQIQIYDTEIVSSQNLTETQLPDLAQNNEKLESLPELSPQQEVIKQMARSPTPHEEDEMAFTEMEGMSAAVDYFFGRYNEITVTRPKKKTPIRAKPPTNAINKSIPPPDSMSASEITSVPKSEISTSMEQSASAVLEAEPQQVLLSSGQTALPNQQPQRIQPDTLTTPISQETILPTESKSKDPAVDEYLSFADDYLFGCYNQVVIPKKPKKKPVPLAPIPKLGSSLTRTSSFQKEEKPAVRSASPEVAHKESGEEIAEGNESSLENASVDTSVYDDVFHDLPSEMLSNQSFDDGGSIYYESFQDAVEDIQGASPVNASVVNVRAKTVHFEEPQAPIVPPRRNKAQSMQKAIATTSNSTADEYLFRQYDEGLLYKKKLPVCSEDFKINQGLEPTEFPCDIPLQPDEDLECVLSSEINVEIPSKTIESSKISSEYDFGDSEQPLDSVKCVGEETSLADKAIHFVRYQDDAMYSKDDSFSIILPAGSVSETPLDDVLQNVVFQSSDIQSSENAESFEELSIPEQSAECLESFLVSSDLGVSEEHQMIPDKLSSNIIDSAMNNKAEAAGGSQEVDSYEQDSITVPSDVLEMDQYVFIDENQDIIDDTYNLYDIQETLESSIGSELNYVGIKSNTEDEAANDSEQEWKRNENIKNTLNASFIDPLSNKAGTSDQTSNILDESQNYCDGRSGRRGHLSTEHKVEIEEQTIEDAQKDELFVAEKSEHEFGIPEGLHSSCTSIEETVDVIVDKSMISEPSDDQAELYESSEVSEQDFETQDNLGTASNKIQVINLDQDAAISQNDNELLKETSESVEEIMKDNKISNILIDDRMSGKQGTVIEGIDEISSVKELTEHSLETDQEANKLVIQPLSVLCHSVVEMTSVGTTIISGPSEMKELESAQELNIVSEQQLIDVLDDLEASFELSDNGDDLSDDVSVSTQIAISTKLEDKDFDTNDSSHGSGYSKVVDEREECVLDSLNKPLKPEQSVTESSDFEVLVMVSDGIATTDFSSKVKEQEKGFHLESSDISDNETAVIDSEKLAPTLTLGTEPSAILDSYDSEIGTEEPRKLYSTSESLVEESGDICSELYKDVDYGLDKFLLKSSSREITDEISGEDLEVAEQQNVEFILESDSVKGKFDNVLPEQTVYLDVSKSDKLLSYEIEDKEQNALDIDSGKLLENENEFEMKLTYLSNEGDDIVNDYETGKREDKCIEFNSDYLVGDESIEESAKGEEESLSVMSHFYNEWYQIDQPSANFSLLSIDSIYAKYGAAESSESGNESDIDNASGVNISENIQKDNILPPEENFESTSLQKSSIEKCEVDISFAKLEDKVTHETEEQGVYYMSHKADAIYSPFVEDRNICNMEQTEHEGARDISGIEQVEHEARNISSMEQAEHEKAKINEQTKYVIDKKIVEESENLLAKSELIYPIQKSLEKSAIIEQDLASAQNQETIEIKSTESKFSTSKSCQTEDSFEEEIFFDSFDDTFTIPSHLNFPIEDRVRPPTNEISIQCELISIEDILSSEKILSTVLEKQDVVSDSKVPEVTPGPSKESKTDNIKLEQTDIPVDREGEESSCESFEDSDSDLFIESHSSHDELDADSGKREHLYAEIDSDTGFSSGSECGWTRKSDIKQKHLSKGKKSYEVTVVEGSEIILECQSEQLLETKGISSQITNVMAETPESQTQSVEGQIIEKINIVEKSIEKIKQESIKKDTEFPEVSAIQERESHLPSDIIERAVTPVAIPQYPSFDEDLIFVEVEGNVETTGDSEEKEEAVCTTPTVEYFYGPLPDTVNLENPSDINERFFEIASDLPETMSVSETSSALGDISSIEQTSTEGIDDESSAETFSSIKNDVDNNDSISEYYPLPDSSILSSARESITENDNFSLAFSEFSNTSFEKSLGFSGLMIQENDESEKIVKYVDDNMFDAADTQQQFLADDNGEKDQKFDLLASKINEIATDEHYSSVEESKSCYEAVISDNLTQNIITSPIISEDFESANVSSVLLIEDIEKTTFDDELTAKKISNSADKILPANFDENASEILVTPETVNARITDNVLCPSSSDTTSEKLQLSRDTEPTKNLALQKADNNAMSKDSEEITINKLSKISDDVPSVPSDIVRYLYYDDAVTFDDDSFYTQSDNLEIPSLAAENTLPVATDNKTVIAASDSEKGDENFTVLPKSEIDFNISTSVEPQKVIEEDLAIEALQINTPELAFSEVIAMESCKIVEDAQFVDVSTPIEQMIRNEIPICAKSETAVSEVVITQDEADHPAVLELANENLQNIYENMEELAASLNVSGNALVSPKEKYQDVAETSNSRQAYPDVPKVPSDVIRYLYYGDDITFDETSFHSQSEDLDASGLPLDEVSVTPLEPFEMNISDLSLDVKAAVAVISKVTEEQVTPLTTSEFSVESHVKPTVATENSEGSGEFSYKETASKPDLCSMKYDTAVAFDNSESIDKWFDLEEDKSVPSTNSIKEKGSEHHSTTKSSVLKDSEEPYIPEIILCPKLESNIPVAKIDIDEVTDISTHFTMTDDSDKFSDIESDTSLNFEEECIMPAEKEAGDINVEESSIKDNLQELDIATPNLIASEDMLVIAEMAESFRKESNVSLELETQKETKLAEPIFSGETEKLLTEKFIKYPVDTLEHSEIFDECVTSDDQAPKEFSEDFVSTEALEHSEVFDECVTSDELKQSEIFDECVAPDDIQKSRKDELVKISVYADTLDQSKVFDECVSADEVKQHSKEMLMEDLDPSDMLEPSEIFDECECISDELASKEDFLKDTIIAATLENSKIFAECIVSEECKQPSKEENIKDSLPVDVFQHSEMLDECITSDELRQSSKEELVRHSISTDTLEHPEIFAESIASDVFKQSSKEEFNKDIISVDTSENSEVFDECVASSEYSEPHELQSTEYISSSLTSDIHQIQEDLTKDFHLDFKEQSLKCAVLNEKLLKEDENGNITDIPVQKYLTKEPSITSDTILIISEIQGVSTPRVEIDAAIPVDKPKEMQDDHTDFSLHASSKEESFSISGEVTENWLDAESMDVENEESVYDLPEEHLSEIKVSSNTIVSDTPVEEIFTQNIRFMDEEHFEILPTDKTDMFNESVEIKEEEHYQLKVDSPFMESEAIEPSTKTVPIKDIESETINIVGSIEVSDHTIDNENNLVLSDSLIECIKTETLLKNISQDDEGIKTDIEMEGNKFAICMTEVIKSEISTATEDPLGTYQTSETAESTTDSKQSLLSGLIKVCTDTIKSGISYLLESSELDSTPSTEVTDSLLLLDLKNISEIKMEGEAEKSTTSKDTVNNECVSTDFGDEPNFSWGGTMYYEQEVQSEEIESKELCVEESAATEARRDLSGSDLGEEYLEGKSFVDGTMEVKYFAGEPVPEILSLKNAKKEQLEILEQMCVPDEISLKNSFTKDKLTTVKETSLAKQEIREFCQQDLELCEKISESDKAHHASEECETYLDKRLDSTAKDNLISKLTETDQLHDETTVLLEKVDFKGGYVVSDTVGLIHEDASSLNSDTEAVLNVCSKNTFKIENSSQPHEVIDFKGNFDVQVDVVDLKSGGHADSENLDSTPFIEHTTVSRDSDALHTIDFKDHVADLNQCELINKNVDVGREESSKYTMLKQKELSHTETGTLEIVDFKGCFAGNHLDVIKSSTVSSDIDVTTNTRKFDDNMSFIETGESSDIVDFKGDIISDYSKTEVLKKIHSSKVDDVSLISDIDHTVNEQTVTLDSIAISELIEEQENKYESEESISLKVVDSYNYNTSEESSDLYSGVETLTSTEDNTLQFYSLSDDVDDTLNTTTSEEFTDVQSHLTSTEESDKWSDVEGDFSFEDSEFDKDKTPVRSLQDSFTYSDLEGVKHFTSVIQDIDTGTGSLSQEAVEKVTCINVTAKSSEIASEQNMGDQNVEIEEDKTCLNEITAESKIISESKVCASILSPEVFEDIDHKNNLFETTKTIIASEEVTTVNLSEQKREQVEVSQTFKATDELTDLKTEIEFSKCHVSDDGLLELSTDKDPSVFTSTEDFTDLSSYNISNEDSEKWSDVESEMHVAEVSEDSENDALKENKVFDAVSDVSDQVETINDNFANQNLETCEATEEPLMEHFANIQSINEQLTIADTFSSFDTETAVPRMHDIIDTSAKIEKTESERWLEADTDNSVSEFEEDVIVSTEQDESSEIFDSNSKKKEDVVDVAVLSTQQCTDLAYASTTSTSSMYTDLEHSDQVSDTCADISLQGATTDNSDKWSDFEAEALIDDALYGNVLENLEISDFPQPLKMPSEKEQSFDKGSLPDTEIKIAESSIPITVEISDKIIEEKIIKPESLEAAQLSSEIKVEVLKSAQSISFEGPDSSSVNLTVSGQITLPTESSTSSLLSTPNNALTGMSDEEFTNVTPLDVAAEESDKWSDISGDTSEELEEDSSVSLKADSKLLEETESDVTHGEFKSDLLKAEDSVVLETEKTNEIIAGEIEILKLIATTDSLSQITVSTDTKECEEFSSSLLKEQPETDKMRVMNIDPTNQKVADSYTEEDKSQEHLVDDTNVHEISLKTESDVICDYSVDVEGQKKERSAELKQIELERSIKIISQDEETTSKYIFAGKEPYDEILESKQNDESETFDNYTDVPTHTLTSETSDMYCELESDYSVEDFEPQHLPSEEIIISDSEQKIGDSRNASDYRDESSLSPDEFVENVDAYALDTIPENELENYEEEYSLSEHFEINEDELIYPLPYNDWIEQSFDLKEYGVEAVFSDAGSDTHGYGITHEEFDDEDIQRAIDFNISNFEEEDVENVGTTESFKTMSNDTSPHLKASDKEYDTWSTADAPSIEQDDHFDDDLIDHDDVLSKIDELLAEDFGDLDHYQTESPLKLQEDEEEDENYAIKDISTLTSLESEVDNMKSLGKSAFYSDKNLPEDIPFQSDKKFEVSKPVDVLDQANIEENFSLKEFKKEFKACAETEFVEQVPFTETSGTITLSKGETPSSFSDENQVAIEDIKKIIQSSEETAVCLSSFDEVKKADDINTVLSSEDIEVPLQFSTKQDKKIENTQVITPKDEEISVGKVKFISKLKGSSESSSIDSTQNFSLSSNEALISSATTVVKQKSLSNLESTIKSKSAVDYNEGIQSVSDDASASFVLQNVKKDMISKSECSTDSNVIVDHAKHYQSSTEETSVAVVLSKTEKETCSMSVKSKIVVECEDSQSSSDETSSSVVVPKTKGETPLEAECSMKSSVTMDHKINQLSSDESSISFVLANAKEALSAAELNVETCIFVQGVDSQSLASDASVCAVLDKAKEETKSKTESSIKSSVDIEPKHFQSSSDENSATITLPSGGSDELLQKPSYGSSTSESSTDIPKQKQVKSADIASNVSIEQTTTSIQKSLQSSQQSVPGVESSDSKSNIPDKKILNDSKIVAAKQSVNETHSDSLRKQSFTEFDTAEIKPDIPKKTKRKSIDLKEGSLQVEESLKKPALPPKKRRSTSESPSSSIGGSLSSSLESLGSFESACSEKSSRSISLKTADEPSGHSSSPDVPARRSRSSRLSSSTKSTDSNASSASSTSLRIRRRSSNFKEPEPVDLSKKRASIDERMLKLQNEGKCANKEKAFIAAKLIEMQFEEEDALMASRQCNSVYHAVKFLTQLCELCNCRFPINLMASMVHCTHRACRECLKAHFTSLIYDRSVFALLCPVCHKPDITDQNIQEYFNHLDMMLRNFLDVKVYDLFQRKLRDEVLTKDPNFHWCSQCSSGFIASPRLKKLYCPDCSAITCAMCHQTWELEHEGVHCERFQQWKDMHTPEPPPAGLVKFLIDRGVSCPSCGLVYAQACGGCMMYKCSHCSFEFCGFCIQPLKRAKDCSNKNCESLGLHIHHLHNCLFYIRDKDISEIQMLLEEESITYLTIPPKDQIVKSRCQVREQKHVHGAIIEERCGRDIEPYCGGLCRIHYHEYLAELLRMNNISPLSIMTIQDLQFMLRKSRNLVPEKMKGETSEDYYDRLLKLITSTLP